MLLIPLKLDPNALATVRGYAIDICAGTAFIVVGFVILGIALVRRRVGVRVFYWLALWSIFYGITPLCSALVGIFPHWMQVAEPYTLAFTSYLVLPFASLSIMEATRGWMRRFSAVLVALGLAVAAAGIGTFFVSGDPRRWLLENNLVASGGLIVLLIVVSSRKLFERSSVMPARGLFALGVLVFTVEALYSNIAGPLGYSVPNLVGHLGFALLLAGFGHSALQMVTQREQRLMAIEGELEVAREIQNTILPKRMPHVQSLAIAAAYEPMAAVAGDFYEFLPRDEQHAGFLVADVCGHGVPAALIASMLKVAVQSAAEHAEDPAEFLHELNCTLATPLQGKLVSAAYLWVDMEQRVARYSAAGHPPLLRWHNRVLESIESNGLLFGVLPNAEYPVREIALDAGDRLMLYTDGVTEAENARGEAFGDARLGALLTEKASSQGIVDELRRWNGAQQDDATLILVDVD